MTWAALRVQLQALTIDVCWLAQPESVITLEQAERLEALAREIRERMAARTLEEV